MMNLLTFFPSLFRSEKYHINHTEKEKKVICNYTEVIQKPQLVYGSNIGNFDIRSNEWDTMFHCNWAVAITGIKQAVLFILFICIFFCFPIISMQFLLLIWHPQVKQPEWTLFAFVYIESSKLGSVVRI